MCRHLISAIVFFAFFENGMLQLPPNVSALDSVGEASYQNVTNLYGNVLMGYDKRVKPRKNQSEFVKVTFLFEMFGITEFDTASQKLSVLGFFFFQWKDDILSWKPKSYGGIKVAKLPLKDIWSPVMTFNKDFHGSGVVGDGTDGVIFAHTGDATWTPAGIFSVFCDVTTKFYPFDRQSCIMSIYAADAASSEINLQPSGEGVTKDRYQPNSEWILVDVRVEKVNMLEGYFCDIIIDLERRTEFLIYTVVSPLVLLSILNVGIFIVPIDSGEKGSIAVTLFLSYGIFVTAIKDDLPHNSVDISYFLIYIQLLLMFSVATVLYCFTESWIYSVHADKAVLVCSSGRNKESKLKNATAKSNTEPQESVDNLATSFKVLSDSGKVRETRHTITWRKLLRWIDIALMLISVCVVSISTAIFFYYLSRRNSI